MLAAVVFCQGCPWRCRYCHNPHLIPRCAENLSNWGEVAGFLRRRQGLLDAVVFSGGEPTLQPGLPDACREASGLGFRVGLHTAGTYPDRLADVLPLLDWVGLDVKAPFDEYEAITGVAGSGDGVQESLRRVLDSGVRYEVRTTVHPDLLSIGQVRSLAQALAAQGVEHYVLQEFRSRGCRDAGLCQSPASGLWPELGEPMARLFRSFQLRSA